MPDIHIHRQHTLGLARARQIAWQWAEEVEAQFGMDCTVLEGETSDTVEFSRSGVKGELIVAADHFDLSAKLGFLLGAFAKMIEEQIQGNLDALLGDGGGAAAASAKAGKGPAAKAAKATTAAAAPVKAAAKSAGRKPAKG